MSGAEPVLLGVRHHGPGSARAVRAALERLRPDAVLIEGPPEADPLLALAADEAMVPPVALLAHVVDEPGRSAFWPFAGFSPEWVALRYALRAGAEVRMIDLPAANSLAAAGEEDESEGRDAIAELAAAAGHANPDAWWEDVVEHRAPDGGDPLEYFRVLAEAMAELRGDGSSDEGRGEGRDARREAFMRRRIRAARREGFGRIAVVCGAWHVPALERRVRVAEDDALLKGLAKERAKVEVTWVPWTNRRLGRQTGYGAGVASPGWYQHLFAEGERDNEGKEAKEGKEESGSAGLVRWMTRVAGLLREEDLPVSSAHVIEAVRLAEALAALRGRPAAGLDETMDAVRSVLCEGSDVPLELVRDRLVVGDALGAVPDAAPAVPLQRDLARQQRVLRLKPEAGIRELDLDLREPTGAARSRLLHRLRLLGIEWGTPVAGRTASTGTFRESWRLCWEPELAVRVAEAGVWGTTVVAAAEARACDAAAGAGSLPELTALSEQCLLADLPEALSAVLRALADRAALDTDVAHLAQALPALVRTARYGDVRGTDAGALRALAEGVATRVCVGLPPACAGLDQEAAAEMRGHVEAVHGAVALLGDKGLRERWAAALESVARRNGGSGGGGGVPGVLRGRAVRLLLDDGRLDGEEAGRRLALALSRAAPPLDAAGWIEGFLGGSGVLLVRDPLLLGLVDGWLMGVSEEVFPEVLPLLRRAFAGFEPGVRRAVADFARGGGAQAGVARGGAVGGAVRGDRQGFAPDLDRERADAVLPVLTLLLGRAPEQAVINGEAAEDD